MQDLNCISCGAYFARAGRMIACFGLRQGVVFVHSPALAAAWVAAPQALRQVPGALRDVGASLAELPGHASRKLPAVFALVRDITDCL